MSKDTLRSFMLVADTTQSNFREILDEIDAISEIRNWYKFFPSAAVLVSYSDIDILHEKIRQKLPGQRYLLVELERGNKNGWLPRKVWDFMNNPTPVV